MSTVPILITRGKPARNGEVKHDVPRTGLLSVLATFVAEFDDRFRDKFFGDEVETDGRIACILRDQLCLSF
jgi:hypothetical protein